MSSRFAIGLTKPAIGPRRSEDDVRIKLLVAGDFHLHLNTRQDIRLQACLPAREARNLATLVVVPTARPPNVVPLHHASGERCGDFHIHSCQSISDEAILTISYLIADKSLAALDERCLQQAIGDAIREIRIGTQVPQVSERFQSEADIAEECAT